MGETPMLLKMRPRLRFIIWTIAVTLLLFGQLAWLFLLRGPRILARDAVLIGGQFIATLPIIVIALLLKTTPPDAIKLRRRTSEWCILAGVALLQFVAVALLRPALSEDVLRYRVDGRMLLDRVSPYATAPLDWEKTDSIDSLVPFPDMRTIYPALSQATFALGAVIENSIAGPTDAVPQLPRDDASPWRRYLEIAPSPYRATVFRAMYAATAVAMTLVLLQLLRANDHSPWWSVLIAWNPLVTLEIGGMGHQDVIGVVFVLLSLYALVKRRPFISVGSLALAAAVKPFALLIAPFVFRDVSDKRTRAAAAAAACVFALTLIACYVPPVLIQHGYVGWRETAQTYSRSWEANGSVYELITRTLGDGDEGRASERAKHMARLIAAAALIATALLAWRFRAAPATAGYWLCLIAVLVAPVAYPWYLLWALCFVPLLRGEAGWTAIAWSGTIGVCYATWHQPTWRMSSGELLVEYGVVYAVLMIEIGLVLRRARAIVASAGDADATSDSEPSLFPPPLRGSSA
jgi:hypothetical protein